MGPGWTPNAEEEDGGGGVDGGWPAWPADGQELSYLSTDIILLTLNKALCVGVWP